VKTVKSATAIEAMTAYLAAELGPAGIRVVCLRPEGMPESWAGAATECWSRPPRDIETQLKEDSPLRRVTTLADLADVAAFMASDRAAAMTGTVANVTSGTVMD
jgi:enoyl-[acyl-carrier-protein] reductase (NADH)